MSRPRLLVVDDEEHYRTLLSERLERKGYAVATAADGAGALSLAEKRGFDVALLDIIMPGIDGLDLLSQLKALDPVIEAVMLTGHASVDTAIRAMKLGAHDYLAKPYKLAELDVVVARAVEKRRLTHRCAGLGAEAQSVRARCGGLDLIGDSPAWRRTLTLIEKAAASDAPVLITGESGVGKEKVATALHTLSGRAGEPLVPVDCGALPEHLVESELFGHRRGAFTGAVADKDGLFQTAGAGCIFLDEIGELSPASQAKLLRVLETGDFRPLGHTALRRTRARVIAATNRDLAEEARAGRFRRDLLYRLDVLHIHVPPLRDRAEDVPALVAHFLARSSLGRRRRIEVAAAAMRRLADYRWPGNVRELRNVVERLLVLTETDRIDTALVAAQLGAGDRDAPPAPSFTSVMPLAQLERSYVEWVLSQCDGNISDASRRLGISRSTLYRLTDPAVVLD